MESARRHYTRDGAHPNFDEQKRSTLTPGNFADLVVLPNILTILPMDILKTKGAAHRHGRQGHASGQGPVLIINYDCAK